MKCNLMVMEGHIWPFLKMIFRLFIYQLILIKKKCECMYFNDAMYEFKVHGNLSTLTYGITMDNICPCFQEKLGKGT